MKKHVLAPQIMIIFKVLAKLGITEIYAKAVIMIIVELEKTSALSARKKCKMLEDL